MSDETITEFAARLLQAARGGPSVPKSFWTQLRLVEDNQAAILRAASEASRRRRGEDMRALEEALDRALQEAWTRNPSGPPPGLSLTVEMVDSAVAEMWVSEVPKQEAVAAALGVTSRRIRQVTQPTGGWRAVLGRARSRNPEL